jgi:valyl-tRNA synthetase
MIMFSLYETGKVPFRDVYLWSMVADSKGIKMSKSKGNVINPIELVDKYGADALRMSLIYGTPAGSKVILSEDKVRGMRNFSNKIWNIARYVFSDIPQSSSENNSKKVQIHEDDEWIIKELNKTITKVTQSLEKYQLNEAAEVVYDFVWHTFADQYIEKSKTRRVEAQETLVYVLVNSLKLLHPFMPFVTEAIWSFGLELKLQAFDSPHLITSLWPNKA